SVPPTASIDQYVEDVPTSSGSSVPGVTNETRAPQPQSTADALDTVAESSAYGAPKRGVVPGRTLDVSPTTSVSAALRSTVGALGTATDARLLGLLFVVLATTAGAVALGAQRAQS
ncbi:MAG: hypothetical protein H0U82_04065, partial [Actinobacteria bacterium]|nr:hypothetical protein [Actinomycetota bacterium]